MAEGTYADGLEDGDEAREVGDAGADDVDRGVQVVKGAAQGGDAVGVRGRHGSGA